MLVASKDDFLLYIDDGHKFNQCTNQEYQTCCWCAVELYAKRENESFNNSKSLHHQIINFIYRNSLTSELQRA